MDDRSILGPADLADHELVAVAAEAVGVAETGATLGAVRAEVVPYELTAITTGGRYWVSGVLRDAVGADHRFRVFVKVVHSFARSPLFQGVPEHLRAVADASVPWRTEALAYRSDLGSALPEGLIMPRALRVVDLDDASAAIWLAEVPVVEHPWDLARRARAALLLGRLAASDRLAPYAGVGEFAWTVRDYQHGRLEHQVLPMLEDDGIWTHPLVASSFDAALRDRMRAAGARTDTWIDELATLPVLTGHGDACPNNLLGRADPESFVLIDYAYWNRLPVGFDLAQLLVGDVQIGRQPATELEATEEVVVPAYVEGLRAEGCDLPVDVVRRAHALQLLVFTGLSCLPFEHLESPPTPALHRLVADRAALARFSLDLVDATS